MLCWKQRYWQIPAKCWQVHLVIDRLWFLSGIKVNLFFFLSIRISSLSGCEHKSRLELNHSNKEPQDSPLLVQPQKSCIYLFINGYKCAVFKFSPISLSVCRLQRSVWTCSSVGSRDSGRLNHTEFDFTGWGWDKRPLHGPECNKAKVVDI